MNKKIHAIGIDIGGTDIKAVLFDGEKVLESSVLGTPKTNVDHLLVMINAILDPLFKKAHGSKIKIKGIGLSIAGTVDSKEKKILVAPNINILNNHKIGKIIENTFGYSTEIDNDGHCFLRAEAKIGAGKKYSNIYALTLGTSIGTAWWVNGNVYQGFHGSSGEVAHTIIDYSDKVKLETAYQKLTQNNPAQLAEEAYRGDVLAEKAYEEIGEIIGLTLANITNIIDPEIFIIGGGVIESSELFFGIAKKTMRNYIQNPEAKKIKILKSKIGKYAGAIGAALLIK